MTLRRRAALGAAVAAVGLLLFAEAAALPTAWLPVEEAAGLARARGGGTPDSPSAGILFPAVLAPAARTLSADAAYRLAQALSAAFWAATMVPAYLLARRLVQPSAALVVAGLAVLVPAAVYATAAVPDALALLLGTSSLAVLARASARGSWRSLLAALALATGAALARPWFAVLPPALLVAYGLPREQWRSLARWPAPLAVAALLGIGYLALARAAPEAAIAVASLDSETRAAAASLAIAAVGVGVVPWLLAASGLRPVAALPESALLVACLPALALAAGVLGTLPPGRGVDERPLLLLAPLVLALAARAWLDGAAGRLRGAFVAGALVVGAALALPEVGRAPAARAAGLSVVSPDGGSRAYVAAAVSAAVIVGFLLLVVLGRRALLLPAALAILLLVGQAAAWSSARAEARALAAGEPAPRSWVDSAAGPDSRVVVTGPPEALDEVSIAQLTLWNRSVRGVQELSFLEVDPHSGQLGVAPGADFAVVRGTELAGTEVARSTGAVLVRPVQPFNLAETVEGVFPDGWSGEQAVYRRFSGSRGTVVVTIGRPDAPAAEVSVEAWRGEEVRLTARDSAQVAAGGETQVTIDVPAPQFRVLVRIEPTFPAADGRQLGARVRFEYRPAQ